MSLNVLFLDIFVDFERVCFFSNQKILEKMRKFLVRNEANMSVFCKDWIGEAVVLLFVSYAK